MSIRMDASRIPPELRRDLLRYLAATSEERARLIGELIERNPGMSSLLIDLEVDDDLRARFEIEMLRGARELEGRPLRKQRLLERRLREPEVVDAHPAVALDPLLEL